MNKQATNALAAIAAYKSNNTIMQYVTTEAREKVASEIRKKTGSGTTAKAVELLEIRHKNIAERVNYYINAGLVGCYLAKMGVNE